MNRFLLAALFVSLTPSNVFAAGAPAGQTSAPPSVVTASSSLGNVYTAGASVIVTTPVENDLSAAGGSIVAAAPVGGDALFLAGSIDSRAPVAGDFRAVGGSITIEKPVTGDLVAFGASVYDAGRVDGDLLIAALNTTLTAGAAGTVSIYGNNVSLAGDFASDVSVVASGRITLAPGTIIRGSFSYEAPEPVAIPASATIRGKIVHTNISYLPNASTSRMLALASVGFFLFARILGALILAGLLTGLFPRLAETAVERVSRGRLRDHLLMALLGAAVLVATPILSVILMLTFVGIGVALLVLIGYVLLTFVALIYAGILLGGFFARRFAGRRSVRWYDGVLGTLALSLVALLPFVGLFVLFLSTAFTAGVLLRIFFDFAFPHDEHAPHVL